MPDFDPADIKIINFPHPILRYEAKPIRRVDANLKAVADRMLELMYEFRGVGLAATQVGLPMRMFVMNATGKQGEGTELVFINPVISRPRSNEEAEEGCLSLPNVHGNVVRAKTIRFNAFDISGKEVDEDVSGFEARIIQHETDHLNGVLFIDRMKEGAIAEIEGELDTLNTEFRSRQRNQELADDSELLQALQPWEAAYC